MYIILEYNNHKNDIYYYYYIIITKYAVVNTSIDISMSDALFIVMCSTVYMCSTVQYMRRIKCLHATVSGKVATSEAYRIRRFYERNLIILKKKKTA